MATRTVQLSSEEKKFVAVVDRVMTDPEFAKRMQDDPATALTSAGYKLTPAQKRALANPKSASQVDAEMLRIPTVRPVVRILTKGTQPVVQVAVNTILAATAGPEVSPRAKTAAKKAVKAKKPASRKR